MTGEDKQDKAVVVQAEPGKTAAGRVEFKHPTFALSFTLPARMTVREQLSMRAQVNNGIFGDGGPESNYVAYWNVGLGLIQDWLCDRLPDPAALDLDSEDDAVVANIVIWTANTVAAYLLEVGGESVPKNS